MTIQLGWLDTNLFIHALYAGDREHARSRAIVEALTDGRAEGWLSPLVMHELTYTLLRRPQFASRMAIYTYVMGILGAPGVQLEDPSTLQATLARWASGSVSFVDAYLAELAQRDSLPVCSANQRDFPGTSNSYAGAQI